MKLIYAIVNNDDNSRVSSALMNEGFFATKLASTGGFLRTGSTTFIICTDDDKVNEVIEIISKHSKKRSQMISSANSAIGANMYNEIPVEVSVGGATVFVTNVERFEKL